MQSTIRSGQPAPAVLPLPRYGGPARHRALSAAADRRPEHSLSLQQVSSLLWHGLGLNRHGSGGRAAVPAGGRRDLEIYVCLPGGSYRYDAPDHALHRTTSHDCRLMAGCGSSGVAPALALVYVDGGVDEDTGWEESGRMPDADAATVAAHIAAYCATAGLESLGSEWHSPLLGAALGIGPPARVVLTQAIRGRSTH